MAGENIYTIDPESLGSREGLVLRQGSRREELPWKEVIPFFKELAAKGQLYWGKSRLLADFFTQSRLGFTLEEGDAIQVVPFVVSGKQRFPLSECDAVCSQHPSWCIRKSFLKRFDPVVPRDVLRWAWENRHVNLSLEEAAARVAEWREDEIEVEFADGVEARINAQAEAGREVLPFLRLRDPRGAFADLWMDYGDETFPYHDPLQSERNRPAEDAWEKDLLETAFIRKDVGSSHYYCPVDQVAKSLAFLLELGWKVMDMHGKRVCLQQNVDLQVDSSPRNLQIRGKVDFGDFQAPIQDLVGTFNRRETFVKLGADSVGLLDSDLLPQTLTQLAADGEVSERGIRVRKNQFGSLAPLFDLCPHISCDASLNQLRDRIDSFTGVEVVNPAESFQGELREYQQQGLSWLSFLDDFSFSGLLADDMGLGKTVQVIAFLSRILGANDQVLIVVPRSLLFHWKGEIERFLPGTEVQLHHGSDRSEQMAQVNITTYGTLRRDVDLLAASEFRALILDEAQQIKNPNSQISQAVCQLQATFRLSLTGTPVENSLEELWAHFRFLMPDLLGDLPSFSAQVLAAQSDSRHLQAIKRKVKPFLLRRRKSEVAKDLPEKTELVHRVEMDEGQRRIYEECLAVAKSKVNGPRMEVLEAILRLRQICCHPLLVESMLQEEGDRRSAKMQALLLDLENLVSSGSKVLVYSQFTSMLSLIRQEVAERQWKHVVLDGTTRNREVVVEQFQEDPETAIFLISLKAGGTGLNLTAADAVLLYDPWWNLAAENQAIDRAHRIGRHDPVLAKRYVTIDSIEEKMMTLKESKRQLVEGLWEGAEGEQKLSDDDLRWLLN